MRHQHLSRLTALLLMIAVLLIAGCSGTERNQPAPAQPGALPTAAPTATPATQAPAPTSIATLEKGGVEDASAFVDPEAFKAALLQALVKHDTEKLLRWMTDPFITGGWRADGSQTAPQDALKELYSSYFLATDNGLNVVEGADLKALMGGTDPLSFKMGDVNVVDAILVGPWGSDGRDEAVLLIARAADNSLKWHSWMVIKGGFSGARLGGLQPYANQSLGISMFLPKAYEIQETDANNILIMAPGVGHPGEQRAAAFIEVKPANGRTVQEITEQVKTDVGPGFNIPPGTAMGLDKATAIVLTGLPGQDVNRQLFVVYNDLLYHITFVPDTQKAPAAYWQMEDLYAMIVNTFHFTN